MERETVEVQKKGEEMFMCFGQSNIEAIIKQNPFLS